MGAENPGPSFISEGPIHPIGRTTFPCVDYFSGLLDQALEALITDRAYLSPGATDIYAIGDNVIVRPKHMLGPAPKPPWLRLGVPSKRGPVC